MAPARSKMRKSTHLTRRPASRMSTPRNPFEKLPVEVVDQILSYLVHPRSRLPGLTERQSEHDFPKAEQRQIKDAEDLTTPPDTSRPYADVFSWARVCHPFNVLASTSKHCKWLVESYCRHLIKTCNIVNIPSELLEMPVSASSEVAVSIGSRNSQYKLPQELIVYRRLWLQTAVRRCPFCAAVVSTFPHHMAPTAHLMVCEDCCYAQTLVSSRSTYRTAFFTVLNICQTLQEIQRVFHIRDSNTLASNNVRGTPSYNWALRIDVEALAFRTFGTRAFHSTHPRDDKRPCQICPRRIVDEEPKQTQRGKSGRLPSYVRPNTRSSSRLTIPQRA
jgi:hypothetical protein